MPISYTSVENVTSADDGAARNPAGNIQRTNTQQSEIISNKTSQDKILGRAFAMEVAYLNAPTEIYERLGDKTPPYFDREVKVCVAVATSKNSINWFVLGEMNKDGQKFRDEIYQCASRSHNELERGCGKYYRGTNSVHVKRLHNDPFESMYNHNHYPLGGLKGADFDATKFPDDVTPDEFRRHLVNFSKHDSKMHNGNARFCSLDVAEKISAEFAKQYAKNEISENNVRYTQDDINELKENAHLEQPCKAPDDIKLNTRGIASEVANARQPVEYLTREYGYVIERRTQGDTNLIIADDLENAAHLKGKNIEQLQCFFKKIMAGEGLKGCWDLTNESTIEAGSVNALLIQSIAAAMPESSAIVESAKTTQASEYTMVANPF